MCKREIATELARLDEGESWEATCRDGGKVEVWFKHGSYFLFEKAESEAWSFQTAYINAQMDALTDEIMFSINQ